MPLPILNPNVDLAETLRAAIAAAIPTAVVEVAAGSPGHFQIRVTSEIFKGRTMLQQQQLVYGAIAHLMTGDGAPVHAIDRLQTVVP
ncbi:MAG TPA: BolA/IbaG family iron-sulfur metabolism protein [Candidatus Kryptonia bacterium]|nr:BolA/IbaG family iron-sulfur metabolism protein [Candidatus Kryptonia bacterium]